VKKLSEIHFMFFGNTSSGVSITVAFLLIARTPMILKENKNRKINYNDVELAGLISNLWRDVEMLINL